MMSALFLLAVLSGCKKDSGGDEDDDDETEFYVRFKANGVQKEFKSMASAQVFPVSNKAVYGSVIQGYQDFNSSNKTHLGIIITNESALAATAYRNSVYVQNSDGDKLPQLLLSYPDEKGDGYISISTPTTQIPPFDKVVSDAVVNITTINNNRISGTFSGTVYLSTDATLATTVKITEGKFNVSVLQ